MNKISIWALALTSLCMLGCDVVEFDRVTVKVQLLNSSDTLRRQVELSEVGLTLASSQGEIQPASIEKVYTVLPQVTVNPSAADSSIAQWKTVYSSHESQIFSGEWIDSQAANASWNGIEPETANVRVVFKKIDSPIYCSYTGTAVSIETTVAQGDSYLMDCAGSSSCPEDGDREIRIANDVTYLVTVDVGQATCSAVK